MADPKKYLSKEGLEKLWGLITTNFVAKEDGKGLFSGKYSDLTGVPTKLSEFENDLGLDDVYLKKTDAESTYVKISDYNTKIAALEKADTDNLQAAKDYVDDAVGAITGFDFQIVESLPEQGEKGIIYLVAATPDANVTSDHNVYDEYIWITSGDSSSFEHIGTTKMDLTGYLKEIDIATITTEEIDAICVMPSTGGAGGASEPGAGA